MNMKQLFGSEHIEKERRRMRETINGDSDLRLASPSAINEATDSATENLEKHMEWAVKFQVLGRTFSEIAAEENTNPYIVSRAVKNILRSIDLPPRSE